MKKVRAIVCFMLIVLFFTLSYAHAVSIPNIQLNSVTWDLSADVFVFGMNEMVNQGDTYNYDFADNLGGINVNLNPDASIAELVDTEGDAIAEADILSSIILNNALYVAASLTTHAQVSGQLCNAYARSSLNIDFSILSEPAYYSLSVPVSDASSYITLTNDAWESFGSDGTVLPVGNYLLTVEEISEYDGFYTYGGSESGQLEVNLTVSPVPIPATIYVLGAGLVGIAGLRKKLIK